MKASVNSFVSGLVLTLVVFASVTVVVRSQTTAAGQPNQNQQSNPSQYSATVDGKQTASQAVAQPAYLTPIAGYQGVLAETLDGSTIAAQAVDEKFNPASAVKLATTLVALQTLGPDHKFVTGIWAAGPIDKSTGTLTGDLVITGRDPSLHYEHAVMVARQLNELGIRTVTGNLIVTPSFTMNFDWSARHSGEMFRDTLDAAKRSASATRAWLDERTLVGDNASLSNVPSVIVNGQIDVGTAPPGAVPILTHRSSKLVDVLKALLCYSNNFMAERIGDGLGGPQTISAMLIQKLNLSPDELSLSSTSGVGINRVTPRAMMKILRALRDELAKNRLALSDILPVAGIDPGTLEDRYTDPVERGSVVAKTGTLIRTDGGASALVGQMKTKSGRVVLFVIMNQRGNVIRFRQNQDTIVTAIQNSLGGAAPFDYQPVKLAMRLANSEFEAARARGEFEPKN
ncbi:MAG TPA: D-alanyl-D-alanine carboxypeptidase [Pyrinomonadaceae bacterium]|nr:D-alanyl-D-alanine carboxypeptidase [Pyrinomonadaceae bacterium]